MTSLLLRNARRVPLRAGDLADQGADRAADPVDVLVEDGTVTAVGPGLHRPEGVEEIDAAGRWLTPGLWDQHVHMGQWTLSSQRLDLSGARTPEDVTSLVAARVAEQPGAPVIGWGHRSGTWDREVTVSELDAVSGQTPVVLISGDGHHAWLNTTALLRLAMPVRDSVVRETEWFAAYPRLVTLVGNDGTSPAAYRRSLETAAALGVVGIVDYEFGRGPLDWVERWNEGAGLLHVRAASYVETFDEVLDAGLRTGDPLPGGGPRLTMGSLKIISDGSLNTRTAWCCEPYGDAHRLEYPAGQPNLSGAELREHLARARAAGVEVATHAIGDAAVAEALASYADTSARGSIEHAQMVGRDDVRRMAELGIRASVQPAHLLDDRDLTEKIWGDRSARCFAFRWMLDDGVELALGSDAPVSPLDPWLAIAAAVHRSADDRDPWHAEQALTAQEALAASVDGQPTVGVGSRGDLVLLDADPLAEHPTTAEAGAALRSMPVALTVVDGAVVHWGL
ncbi:amidohydrolase [Nocardioides marmotae]|uniref:Amidohydrolase family protein n=1 Tax=Nocardioides marmotae TaxID=2663857 RepID=A0A6I3JF87_9ACTN|nr:amidohydrolase family protein [Nocardioides marmotae]MCR6033083.1 amidohydrolase family protein [Gordonia jinghuaiqii]MBC9732583.1 amidohydrolase family protein [Nocardioides marmotae]MTB83702.1 amidohydrolase family protein [Nocardioides marmotae]MTB96735.1 amidohydrolase family protein [Nocardioides marmotae]QKE03055.1 amidohydrolase family protein [Nocardioides marmotae]